MKRSLFTKRFSGLALGLAFLATSAKAAEEGAVYTMDNAAAANHVLVFQRAENGQLTSAGSVATGGAGTGAGLWDPGSMRLSHEGRCLFVGYTAAGEVTVAPS